MKKIFPLFFLLFGLLNLTAQNVVSNKATSPMFPECKNLNEAESAHCFNIHVHDFVYRNFQVPEDLKTSNYKGTIMVLFEVTAEGTFKIIYIDANEERLSKETTRVFGQLPKIEPATYNGIPTYSKYSIKIDVPLKSAAELAKEIEEARLADARNYVKNADKELSEYDNVTYHKFNNPKFQSSLGVPFSHSYYAHFDAAMNQLGTNNHTAVKPYSYAEVSPYFDFRKENDALKKDKKGWWGRKLFNENLIEIQGDGYWFAFNPIIDLQLGKSSPSELKYTYLNTRGIQFQGGLGRQVTFSTTIFETQGRFADYYNRYAESIRPYGPDSDLGDPAVIPGVGIAKRFKKDAYDMSMAEAYITYSPSKIFTFQAGYGRNFIGDGYRSLITTDGVSPYPFFKINTSFWKIKYTNTYMFLKDIRSEVIGEKTYATKYMANHYLSWNATKRLNIGLFESVIWANTNGRGFDMSFFNPIVFYRSVEFASSARTGNALLGATFKYKFNNQLNWYGQFLLDEFSLAEVKKSNQSWKNKYGYQLGVKYFNAFNVENLLLQLEYNHVRPYVYSHSDPLTNYGHANQNVGHQWGGNFREMILVARYHKGRYFADAKFTYGVRGLDFNTAADSFNYGSNIYRNYNEQRPYDIKVVIGQGNKTTVMIADMQAGYLVNPQTNLKLFGSLIYRNFDPSQETLSTFKESTTWFSLGLRCDIFNWYYDY
ncbi:gliding motility protein RemB [Flavobacterium sp. CYK-4]|uniref:energy transducer TonB n=1 Tax=Flavobacterium lotistagni TaxID=2709660 RepID=UPI00140E5C0F|nr:energy transducer TonB [Flavobacterium lotistagni]NHM06764.1 gliding motility protein RemB [Flavobacterium lotistagni]